MNTDPAMATSELGLALSDRLSRSGAIVANLTKLISPRAQESAFEKPGEPGDPEVIEHMGGCLILLYEQLLDWAHEIRSLRVEDRAEKLPELAVAFVAQPIAETRNFVSSYIEQVEAMAAVLAADFRAQMYLTMRSEVPTQDLDWEPAAVGQPRPHQRWTSSPRRERPTRNCRAPVHQPDEPPQCKRLSPDRCAAPYRPRPTRGRPSTDPRPPPLRLR